MHLGNARLNRVKWVSFKQGDSEPSICSCNCNRGDHIIYDPTRSRPGGNCRIEQMEMEGK